MLFNIYDVDGSGALDYKEFSSAVFGGPTQVAAPSRPATAQSQASAASIPRAKLTSNIFNAPETAKTENGVLDLNANEAQLLEHIRKRIAARGARGISGISRKFKIADDNGNKTLDTHEFAKAMHDFRMDLNPKQCSQAFDIFDRDGSGEISYDEFLRSIRGTMNDMRVALCKRAYKIMDTDGSG
jgi:Ca2+-binding EF-hand superfamily protein